MWRRWYPAIARQYGWVRKQVSSLRGMLRHRAAQRERAVEDRRHIKDRARFWAEFHEGERQAEAHCTSLDP